MRRCASLQGWTPIALEDANGPALRWADLRGRRFDQPLFEGTAEIEPRPLSITTRLNELRRLDGDLALDPSVIIAHPSRCGSTLLARLAAAMSANTILVSEPQLLQQLLMANLVTPFEYPIDVVLRRAVRALGQIRFGNERHYVLKLNSQTTRFLPVFRRAFPATPIIWMQRDPAEIVESNLRSVSGTNRPDETGTSAEKILRNLALSFLTASAFLDDKMSVIDYRELPEAAWTRVARLLAVDPNEDDLARMRGITQVHAHHNDRPYAPRAIDPLPLEILDVVRKTLNPLYEALARRGMS